MPITSAVTQQVKHQDAVALRKARQELAPQMRGHKGTMDQHNRDARAARTGRVAVQPGTTDIHELTAHQLLEWETGRAKDERNFNPGQGGDKRSGGHLSVSP